MVVEKYLTNRSRDRSKIFVSCFLYITIFIV